MNLVLKIIRELLNDICNTGYVPDELLKPAFIALHKKVGLKSVKTLEP